MVVDAGVRVEGRVLEWLPANVRERTCVVEHAADEPDASLRMISQKTSVCVVLVAGARAAFHLYARMVGGVRVTQQQRREQTLCLGDLHGVFGVASGDCGSMAQRTIMCVDPSRESAPPTLEGMLESSLKHVMHFGVNVNLATDEQIVPLLPEGELYTFPPNALAQCVSDGAGQLPPVLCFTLVDVHAKDNTVTLFGRAGDRSVCVAVEHAKALTLMPGRPPERPMAWRLLADTALAGVQPVYIPLRALGGNFNSSFGPESHFLHSHGLSVFGGVRVRVDLTKMRTPHQDQRASTCQLELRMTYDVFCAFVTPDLPDPANALQTAFVEVREHDRYLAITVTRNGQTTVFDSCPLVEERRPHADVYLRFTSARLVLCEFMRRVVEIDDDVLCFYDSQRFFNIMKQSAIPVHAMALSRFIDDSDTVSGRAVWSWYHQRPTRWNGMQTDAWTSDERTALVERCTEMVRCSAVVPPSLIQTAPATLLVQSSFCAFAWQKLNERLFIHREHAALAPGGEKVAAEYDVYANVRLRREDDSITGAIVAYPTVPGKVFGECCMYDFASAYASTIVDCNVVYGPNTQNDPLVPFVTYLLEMRRTSAETYAYKQLLVRVYGCLPPRLRQEITRQHRELFRQMIAFFGDRVIFGDTDSLCILGADAEITELIHTFLRRQNCVQRTVRLQDSFTAFCPIHSKAWCGLTRDKGFLSRGTPAGNPNASRLFSTDTKSVLTLHLHLNKAELRDKLIASIQNVCLISRKFFSGCVQELALSHLSISKETDLASCAPLLALQSLVDERGYHQPGVVTFVNVINLTTGKTMSIVPTLPWARDFVLDPFKYCEEYIQPLAQLLGHKERIKSLFVEAVLKMKSTNRGYPVCVVCLQRGSDLVCDVCVSSS